MKNYRSGSTTQRPLAIYANPCNFTFFAVIN
uniref:Uncharacterized protein n=1 Tax=Rhizophora mucronata TaxID=61149 RepID=A0A2P2IWV2_RHIMU